MDYSEIKQNWEKRGFSFGVWSDPPGQIWADYTHDTDELVMLAEGEIELSFGGQILHPRVGEEILIPAQEPHTVRNVGQTTNRWYYGYKHTSI